MSDPIPAVFDSGVFRPLEPVDLAQGTRADVIPRSNLESASASDDSSWPLGYFDATAGALVGEDFDRPVQGDAS
jgi:predicted DNA-binding antitoxin AbrB/MazE fold protein